MAGAVPARLRRVEDVPRQPFALGGREQAAAAYIPAAGGLLLVEPPPALVMLGSLPAGGELHLSFPLGEVTSSAVVPHGQALFLAPGSSVLSSGSSIAVLDAGI